MGDSLKDASYLIENPANGKPKMFGVTKSCKMMNVMSRGYVVKEALRVQMGVQRRLHLQVEAGKHLQIRENAQRMYLAMLERACKILTDQILGGAIIDPDNEKCQGLGK